MENTNSILVLVSTSLTEPNGLRALELANHFRLLGKKTGVYLIQNAVLGSVNEESKILIEGQINSGIDFYCSEEDLTMRGFADNDLHPRMHVSDYSYLVDLMMERYDKVIGAF